MTASIATPMNFLANAFFNIVHDPASSEAAPLAAGVALDVLKNMPVNLFSNVPHFESEVGPDESSALPGAPAGGAGL